MRDELKRLFLSVGLYLVSLYLAGVLGELADERNRSRHPLTDIGFDIVPRLGHAWNALPNYFLVPIGAATLVRIAVDHRRVGIFTRLFSVWGIVFILRGVSVVLTSLPDPSDLCREHRAAASAWKWLLPMAYPICGDLFFSGHTVMFVLCALVWTRYGGRLPAAAAWLVAAAGVLSLIATRYHYSIDVLYGALIATVMWVLYDVDLRARIAPLD